jgi:hypothetical protein
MAELLKIAYFRIAGDPSASGLVDFILEKKTSTVEFCPRCLLTQRLALAGVMFAKQEGGTTINDY